MVINKTVLVPNTTLNALIIDEAVRWFRTNVGVPISDQHLSLVTVCEGPSKIAIQPGRGFFNRPCQLENPVIIVAAADYLNACRQTVGRDAIGNSHDW